MTLDRTRTAVLAKLDESVPPGKTLQAIRAIEALESIGTTQTRQLLAGMTKGPAGARATRDAEVSLSRLAKKATANAPPGLPR